MGVNEKSEQPKKTKEKNDEKVVKCWADYDSESDVDFDTDDDAKDKTANIEYEQYIKHDIIQSTESTKESETSVDEKESNEKHKDDKEEKQESAKENFKTEERKLQKSEFLHQEIPN